MQRKAGQRVFITGASSGIGAALAEHYAGRGDHLLLFARRQARLEEVVQKCKAANSNSRAIIYCGDVCQPVDLQTAAKCAIDEFGGIDVVYANAAIGFGSHFKASTVDDYRAMFETNIFGVLHTIKATLPALTATQGRLVLIGSLNSYVSVPHYSGYSMSKFAVRALAESLSVELKEKGVSVTLICPGAVTSEMRLIDKSGRLQLGEADPIPAWLTMPAPKAARVIVRAVDNRQREQIVTQHARLAIWAKRLFPGLIPLLMQLTLPRSLKGKLYHSEPD